MFMSLIFFENQESVPVEHGQMVVEEGIINEEFEAKIESMIKKLKDGDKKSLMQCLWKN